MKRFLTFAIVLAVFFSSLELSFFILSDQLPPGVHFIRGYDFPTFVVIRDSCRVVTYSKSRRVIRDTLVLHADISVPPGFLLSVTPYHHGTVASNGDLNPTISSNP